MNLLEDNPSHPWQNWLLRHVAFWIIFNTIISVGVGYNHNFPLILSIQNTLVWMPYQIFMAYVLLYGIIPWFFKKRHKTALILLIIWLLLGLLGNFLFRYFVFIPFRTRAMPVPEHSTYRVAFTVNSYMLTNAIAFVAAIPKILRYQYQKERANQQLTHETRTIELQLLKSQVHPHFLFNTLNNLYSLTQKQSSTASEIVLKLSGLLHYMLYECNAPEVPLTKEIAVLQDYIALERLRYGPRLTIKTQFLGDLADQKIAPLLLIPFVENAFKHGAAEQVSQAYIDLHLIVKEKFLFFELVNSQNDPSNEPHNNNIGGIGLKNVKKRLDLIYRQQYELKVDSQSEKFTVWLRIALT
ncbi:hypothetical protein GVN20_13530 [Runella sp. CRIBMP]|uniref:sensor histidine kinase n=1 Tax=Runella sp. CRIBMP TaxID=2683261 RepID=UPI0014125C26|nr:histidine kinase [Runella sp. CRIBMP]NBB20381.1 hypothetical protein [Runella sp. CRIBMP]